MSFFGKSGGSASRGTTCTWMCSVRPSQQVGRDCAAPRLRARLRPPHAAPQVEPLGVAQRARARRRAAAATACSSTIGRTPPKRSCPPSSPARRRGVGAQVEVGSALTCANVDRRGAGTSAAPAQTQHVPRNARRSGANAAASIVQMAEGMRAWPRFLPSRDLVDFERDGGLASAPVPVERPSVSACACLPSKRPRRHDGLHRGTTAEEAAAIVGRANASAPGVMAEHGVAIIANVSADVARSRQRSRLIELVDTKAASTAAAPSAMPPPSSRPPSSAMPAASAPLLSLDPRSRRACSGAAPAALRVARARCRASDVYEVLHGTEDICVGLDHSFFSPGAAPAASQPIVATSISNARRPYATATASASASGRSTRACSTAGARSRSARLPRVAGQSPRAVRPSRPPSTMAAPLFDDRERHRPRGARAARGLDGRGAARPVPARALLVWSSRTSHQGWAVGPALRTRCVGSRGGAPPRRATAR